MERPDMDAFTSALMEQVLKGINPENIQDEKTRAFVKSLEGKSFTHLITSLNGTFIEKKHIGILEDKICEFVAICLNDATPMVYFIKGMKTENDPCMKQSAFITTYNNYSFQTKVYAGVDEDGNEKTKIKKVRFGEFITSIPYDKIYVEGIEWKPHHGNSMKIDDETNTLNLFCGFKAKQLEIYEVDIRVIDKIKNHMRIICNHDEELYEKLFFWIQHIVQTPWEKTQIMPVIFGEQGCGKSVFSDFLIKHVFGDNTAVSLDKLSRITDNFNALLLRRVFTSVSETESQGYKQKNAEIDVLKSRISDPKFHGTKKGVDTKTVNCYNNYLLLTNHRDCVNLTKSSRRELIIEMSSEKVGDFDYFNELHRIAFNSKGGNMFYTYLLNEPPVNVAKLRAIKETALRQEIVEINENPILTFLKERYEEMESHYELPEGIVDGKVFRTFDFYEQYKDWATASGSYVAPRKKLILTIKAFSKKNDCFKKTEKGSKHSCMLIHSDSIN